MNAQTELESIATDWNAEIRDISLPAKEFHINKMWNISQLHPENLHIVSALLHKGLKGRATLSEPNLSGNLGMRAT